MTDNKVIYVRSSKGDKSADASSNEDDIWDDTLLVKAYENAIQLTEKSFLNKKQQQLNTNPKSTEKKKRNEQNWKVGDKCRCKYSEDLKYYEAEIIRIDSTHGRCDVKYVGYENIETVPLKKLQRSAGESARIKQCEQAAEEKEDQSSAAESAPINNSGRKSQPDQKKSTATKTKDQFKKINGFSNSNSFPPFNFPIPEMGNSSIPPPPLPHIFNSLGDVNNETEAMNAMLMSWYMSGYHTGYYQGLKAGKKQ